MTHTDIRSLRSLRFLAVGILAACLSLLLEAPLQAASIYWNVGAGDWSTKTNWTPSTAVPGASDSAFVSNGGTVAITQSGSAKYIYLGNNAADNGSATLSGTGSLTSVSCFIGYSGTGVFTQTSGTNSVTSQLGIGMDVGGRGTYNLTTTASGVLASASSLILGSSGSGIFNQSGAQLVVLSGFILGDNVSGVGSYNLSNGGAASAASMNVGLSGKGNVTQTDGLLTLTGTLFLGVNGSASAAYQLGGVSVLTVGGATIVGSSGAASFTQTGGLHSVASSMYLGVNATGSGAYYMSGSGTLNVAGASYVGRAGTGAFEQSGGSHTVIGNLYLGYVAGSLGSYKLSDSGKLSSAALYVGYVGTGSFTQTGGTNSAASGLFVGYRGKGTYALSGSGTLSTGDAQIGTYGTGSFTQSGSSGFTLSNFFLGNGTSGNGSYSIGESALVTISGSAIVGGVGTGTFTQTDAAVSIGSTLYLGASANSSGTYSMSGTGLLSVAGSAFVGYAGSASFNQTGGSAAFSSGLFVGFNSGAKGYYTLGGESALTTTTLDVSSAGAGVFTQTGGVLNAQIVKLGTTGKLTLTSGTINVVNGGIDAVGAVEFSNSTATINLTSSIFSMTGSTTAVYSKAKLDLDEHSLLITPANLDPTTCFVQISGAGIIHQTGSTITIASTKSIFGAATIADFVDCSGTLAAPTGFGISLNDGVNISGSGSVALGVGSLYVNAKSSGLNGGYLQTTGFYAGSVGSATLGAFSHIAGTASISTMYLGYKTGCTGTYSLSGEGALSVSGSAYVGYAGTGYITQSSGVATFASSFFVGNNTASNGYYALDAGQLTVTGTVFLGYSGTGLLTQTGGRTTFSSNLYLGNGSASRGAVSLSGGELSVTGTAYVGYSGIGVVSHSGGTAAFASDLYISNNATKTGYYYLGGESLLTVAGTAYVGSVGTGVISQSGGTATFKQIVLGSGTTGQGSYDLYGGTLLFTGVSKGSGSASLNLYGGVIQAVGTTTIDVPIYLSGSGGGATFNTNGFDVTVSGTTTGSGGFSKTGSGTLTLSGSNTFSGALYLNGGFVKASKLSALGSGSSLHFNGGGLTLGAACDLSSHAVFFESACGTLNTQSYAVTITSPGGLGGFTKIGAGALTLAGTSTFQGPINLDEGNLQVSSISNLGTTSSLNFNGGGLIFGAAFDVSSFAMNFQSNALIDTQGYSVTLANSIGCSGTGGLTKLGTGILTLLGTNTFTGTVNLNAGILAVSTAANLGAGPALSFNGGTLQYLSADLDLSDREIVFQSGGASIDTQNFNVTLCGSTGSSALASITGSGSLTKLGSGTLTLAGTNDFRGSVNVNCGMLSAASMTALGSGSAININGGGVKFISSDLNISSRIVGIGTAGATFDTNGYDVAFSGAIGNYGGGGITKNGSGVLALLASNSFSGTVTINAGSIKANSLRSFGLGSAIVLNGGGIVFDSSFDLTTLALTLQSNEAIFDTQGYTDVISGTISGTGNLTKLGSGTLTLAGSNTFVGAINVNGGFLAVSALSSLGSVSALNFNGGGVKFISAFDLSSQTIAFHSGGALFDTNGYDGVVSCGIAGTGNLTKLGSGSLTISSPIVYFGSTIVKGGTLKLAGDIDSSVMNLIDVQGGRAILAATNVTGPGLTVQTSSGANFEVANGARTINSIIGSGTTIVSGTATLTVATLVQDTLILGGETGSQYWVASSGDWSNAASWNDGEPTAGSLAYITNGGAAVVSQVGEKCQTLYVGHSSSLSLGGSAALAATNLYVGYSGEGTVTQAGGTNSAGNLVLGYDSGSLGTYNLTGGALIVGSIAKGTGIAQFNFGGGTIQASATMNIAVPITISGLESDTKFNTAGYDLTLSNTVSGTGGFTKLGQGTLILSGTNTFTGTVCLNAGTMAASSLSNLGGGSAINFNGGGFKFLSSFDLASRTVTLQSASSTFDTQNYDDVMSSTISGTGGLTKLGSGTLTLSGSNSFTGTISLNKGLLAASALSSLGSGSALIFNGGGFKFLSSFDLSSRTLAFQSGSASIDTNGYDVAVSNAISGAGGLTKLGLGTLTLSGTNTFAGAVNVNNGFLAASLLSNLGSGTALNFNGGGFRFLSVLDFSSRTIAFQSGGATFDTNGFDVAVSNIISGTGGLTKLGAGTLTLSGTNTFTGAVNVNGGTVALSVLSNLGNGTALNVNGGGLKFLAAVDLARAVAIQSGGATFDTNGYDVTVSKAISGPGGLTKLGSGTLALSGTNSFAGAVIINAGTVAASALSNLGNASTLNFNGGGFRFLSSFDLSSQTISLQSVSSTFDTQSYDAVISSLISDDGGLTKIGAGTLTLSGTNTFTGAVNVNVGTVAVSSLSNLGNGTALNFNGGGFKFLSSFDLASRTVTLQSVSSTFDTQSYDDVISSTISGTGGLTKIGAGTLTLAGANTFTGTVSVNVGTLAVSSLSNLGGGTTLNFNGGSLKFLAALDLSSRKIAFQSGGATFDTNGFDLTVSNVISGAGGLTKVGLGTLILSGANTFTGAVSVNVGTVAVSSLSNLGNGTALNFNGGGLKFLSSFDLARAVAIQSDGATFDTNGFDLTASKVISGAGGFSKIGLGTLTLSGANTFTGAVNVNSGTVAASASSNLGSGSALNFNGGGLTFLSSFTLAHPVAIQSDLTAFDTQAFNVVLSQTVSGDGSLTKLGEGTLTLSGVNTFTGTVNVNAGTLAASASSNLGNGSTLNFNGGSLKFLAAFDLSSQTISLQSASSTFDTQNYADIISSTISGVGGLTKIGSGTLTLSGTNTFAGTINVNVGTVAVSSLSNLGNGTALNFNGGGLKFLTAFDLARAVAIQAGGASMNTNGYDAVASNAISGSGGLTKLGSGILTLSGTNTFTGEVNVNVGTVAVSALSNLGNGTDLNFNGGGFKFLSSFDLASRTVTLQSVSSTFDTQNYDDVISSTISGTGGLAKIGSGTLTLAGANTFTGTVSVNVGTLAVSSLSNLGNGTALNFNGGGFKFLSSFDLASRTIAFQSGGATFDTNGYDIAVSNIISGAGGLTKVGLGTLTLSGANTFTGAVNVNVGTVAVSALSNLGNGTALNFNGGGLSFLSAFTLSRAVALQSGVATWNTNGNNVTASKVISGAGGLTKLGLGTLTLSGSNTFTGALNLNAGILAASAERNLGAGSTLTFDGGELKYLAAFNITSHAVTILSGGATFDTQAFNVVISEAISGTGDLTKLGSGSLTVLLASDYSGHTIVTQGSLIVTTGASSSAASGETAKASAASQSAAPTNSGASVEIVSGASLVISSGTHTLDSVIGSGTTTVSGSAVLVVGTLVQDTLILGDATSSANASTATSNATATIANTATDSVITGATPALAAAAAMIETAESNRTMTVPSATSAVPEPSVWAFMIVVATLLAMTRKVGQARRA